MLCCLSESSESDETVNGPEVTKSLGVACNSFRRDDYLLSAPDSQLLEVTPKP